MFQTVTDKISILGISAVVAMTLREGGGDSRFQTLNKR